MFQKLGPPQLFLTFTCDDFATEYNQLLDGEPPWSDPVLFAQHYRRCFQRMLNYYILRRRGAFGRLVGGITDWAYTVKLQDRGSPHVHLVLWTGRTAEDLVGDNRVVCAQIPNIRTNPRLHKLVLNRQIHTCRNYCHRATGDNVLCRFGYPNATAVVQEFDPLNERAVYQRAEIESNVDPYNPYLHQLVGTSMDMQVNFGNNVALYLSKYMSKNDTSASMEWGMENIQDHFRARVVGAVDAAYFLAGWSKHRSSRGTIYISVVFPGMDERRQLRRGLERLAADDENIFYPTHLEKYEARHRQTDHLTMVEYFTCYMITKEEDIEEEFADEPDFFGFFDRDSINAMEETIFDERINKIIPIACTDALGRRYVRRMRNRL
ncbi:hypothetical protein [Parasitella parasitica]|uniref:Helitron helicase-like domain-containing protein n=1 Tax=Parasitella parasitica TaxID=35722 RepID=A0A0B7N4D6_9FUNG|nr:hypothetical protein [Parasitella parasitica]